MALLAAIDEVTRKPVNLVNKDGTDRLMVDIAGATLDISGDINIDNANVEAKLDTLIARTPDKQTTWQHAGAGITSSTVAETLVAAVVDKRHYVEGLQLGGVSGTGQHAVEVRSAATVIWRGTVNMATDEVVSHTFKMPLVGGVNETISFAFLTTDPGTLYASAQGYTL